MGKLIRKKKFKKKKKEIVLVPVGCEMGGIEIDPNVPVRYLGIDLAGPEPDFTPLIVDDENLRRMQKIIDAFDEGDMLFKKMDEEEQEKLKTKIVVVGDGGAGISEELLKVLKDEDEYQFVVLDSYADFFPQGLTALPEPVRAPIDIQKLKIHEKLIERKKNYGLHKKNNRR